MNENLAGFKGGRGWYFCWLIERNDRGQPEWWAAECEWVKDANLALWFCREQDGKDCAAITGEIQTVPWRVNEHGFDMAGVTVRKAYSDPKGGPEFDAP